MLVTENNLNTLLEEGMSNNGAWSLAQLKALLPAKEFDRPYAWPATGWKKRLIGTNVTESQVKEFQRLKNRHLGHKKRDLPGQRDFESEMYPHLASLKVEIKG